MGAIYESSLIGARLAAVVTAIGTAGYLVIGASALNGASSATTGVLVKIPLGNPAGTVSGNILTLTQPLNQAAIADGTAAKAEIWSTATPTGASHVKVSGLTVGTSGTDVIMTSGTTVTTGQVVSVSPATITHPNS